VDEANCTANGSDSTRRRARREELTMQQAAIVPGPVFISYARVDGANLAARLHADLKRRGVDAWLDTSAVRGGASWTEEIEHAIDGCQSVLAVMSSGSFRSPVCRAEQLRALRKSKRVVPLLAEPNADRPLYLEHVNYRDLSDPTNYEACFDRILLDLAAEGVAPLPTSFAATRITAPPLPPHFVGRAAALVTARQMLVCESGPRVIGLHGMGGLGKTVLAQALCHDRVVQDAFFDAIIWLSVGSGDSDLLEQLREAGKALNDANGDYGSRGAASNQLRTLLRGKAVLLVLDDVVSASQLEPFRSDEHYAPRVRVLFTTQDTSVGLPSAAAMIPAPVLEPAESMQLLGQWAGRPDPSFAAIADRFSHLPLALSITGALLSEGSSGDALLRDLQQVSDIRIDRYSTGPGENLAACFDVTLARLPEHDRQLFYVCGVLRSGSRIPQSLLWTLWRGLQPRLSDTDCKQVAAAFARRALLAQIDDRITVHPLLHKYAAERVQGTPGMVTQCADAIVAAMGDPSWIVRERAIEAIGRVGDRSIFDVVLHAAVADDDMDVQVKALDVLARLGDPRAVDAMIGLLRGNYYETTLAAANVLAAIGEPAVAPLVEALPALRGIGLQDGIKALGWLGDARALPVLRALQQHPDAVYDVHDAHGIVRKNAATEAIHAVRAKARDDL
jgi:hypothetical protein